MARHRKASNTARTLQRTALVGAAAATGFALLASPAGASDDNDGNCPEGSQVTCRVNNYEVPPLAQVGDLVAARVNLLHCPGQVADIKAKVLRQLDVDGTKDWAVKARVLVGQYCHPPVVPVIVVPVVPAPPAADLPVAPAPIPVTPETNTSGEALPTVTG